MELDRTLFFPQTECMNQSSNHKIILNTVLRFVPLLITALVPVFFLPLTTEFFEMNKVSLIMGGTIAMVTVLIAKIATGDRVRIVKSVVDLPLWAFGLVAILATVFSINKTASIYGAYGRWFPSLLSSLGLLAYFYISTAIFNSKDMVRKTLYVLLASISVGSLVALLGYFRIYIGSAEYMRIPGFTLSGSTTTAAILAGTAVGVGLSLLVYENRKAVNYGLIVAIAVNLLYVVLAGIPVGWIALGTSIIGAATYVNLQKLANKKTQLLALGGVVFAITISMILPTTRNLLLNENYPRERTLPLKESWLITSSITREFPILGTGPGTFGLNFPRFRPVSLNRGDGWNLRFDKASNEIFNIMGGMGLVGLLATIFMGSRVLKLVNSTKTTKDDTGVTTAASVIIITLGVTFFFTYATVATIFIFISAMSYIIATNAITKEKPFVSEFIEVNFSTVSTISTLSEGPQGESYTKYVVAIPLLLITGYFGYLNYKNYAAEYYMRRSFVETRTDAAKAYSLQGRAINLNPQRDIYHTTYAQTNLALANILAAKEDLTDTDKQTVQTLISQAIRSSRIATEIINPLNVNNWETRAAIYRSLINVAQDSTDWAIKAYDNAIQLDPTNPRLRLNLGGIYYAAEDYLSAATQFRQATALKNDYANAYYNFAQALKKLENYQNAMAALEITKTLVDVESVDYKKAESELEVLRTQLAQSGAAQDDKPTVAELAGPSVETPAEDQAPLVNQGEQVVEDSELNLDQLPPREQAVSDEEITPEEESTE
jgi:tetratricopeptide (TPR) repeat protein